MPPEDRIRLTNDVTCASTRRPKRSPRTGEAPSFVVAQLQPSTAQPSLEHPVLLAQEFDHVPLFPFEPSEQRRDKEMQRNHGFLTV